MPPSTRPAAADAKLLMVARREALLARGVPLFDFGLGDPVEPAPDFVRDELVAAVTSASSYPDVRGTADLRTAVTEYVAGRFGVALDPEREVLTTAGAREAIFHTPMALAAQADGRDLVLYGMPGYSVFETSARVAGLRPQPHPLNEANHYLLDPAEVGDAVLARTAIVVLNYPHNPSGQVMPAALFRDWVEARDRHGFVLLSDECYCDVYFEAPPHTLLEFGRTGCIVIHSLSKRSGMTGFLSGFLAGDAHLIDTLRSFRSTTGIASQEWTQAAAAAAWRDEGHVRERREGLGAKRDLLLEHLSERGVEVFPGGATLFLWVRVPGDGSDVDYAEQLADAGILVTPGSLFGDGQEGFVRLALAPSLAECRGAVEAWPR
jgi:acetylornithine aminotransferase